VLGGIRKVQMVYGIWKYHGMAVYSAFFNNTFCNAY